MLLEAEELRKGIEGKWEYEYKASPEVPFDRSEQSRGGLVEITVHIHSFGMSAELQAERLWVATKRNGSLIKKRLAEPVPWGSIGGVVITEHTFDFVYKSSDQTGINTDIIVRGDNQELTLVGGSFQHFRSDGRKVEGITYLRKMKHSSDLLWSPSTFACHLSERAIEELHSAALGLSRDALLSGLPTQFISFLDIARNAGTQLLMDLRALNETEWFDGQIPLATWLQNAQLLVPHKKEQGIFKKHIEQIDKDKDS